MKREKKIRFTMPIVLLTALLIGGCNFIQTMDTVLRISEEPKKANPNFLQWVKTIGIGWPDSGNAIACDADNNVYIVGNFSAFADFDTSANHRDYRRASDSDIFLTSVDKDKNYRWTNTISAGGANEVATGVAVDFASTGMASIYVVGFYEHDQPISVNGEKADQPINPPVNLAGNPPPDPRTDKDVFISKFKEDGTYCWTKTIGGYDDDTTINVKTDAWGNVYVLGHFKSNYIVFDPDPKSPVGATAKTASTDGEDPFVLKLSPQGTYLWAITFDSSGGTDVMGFKTGFVCADLDVDVDGNVFIVGGFAGKDKDFDPSDEFKKTMSSPYGSLDMFVLKLDSNKNFVWARQYGAEYLDVATSVALDKTGSIYVAGLTMDTQSDKLVVMKLDNNGNELWGPWKEIMDPLVNPRPSSENFDKAASRPQIRVAVNGKIYLEGRYANPDINFGNFGIAAASWFQDLTAATAGFKYHDGWDPFLIRINSGGVFEWVRTFGGTSDESVYGMAVDGEGSVYLTGRFDSTDIDFNPDLKDPHTPYLVKSKTTEDWDAFIVKFSPQP